MAPIRFPLLEREHELAALESVVDRALAGPGAVAFIEGEPGIGKTRLLDAAADLAASAGMQVLRARGRELERPFAFGVARQLLEPPLRALAGAERRAVLSATPAAASSLIAGDDPASEPPTPASEFALVHGLHWLAVALAARAPLAILIDDAHHADDQSLLWLAYLAERLDDVAAAVVVAAWPQSARGANVPLARVREAAGVEALLQPSALSLSAGHRVVRLAFEQDVATAFARECHRASAGNPLLLAELALLLAREGIAPTEEGAGHVPDARPAAAVARMLDRLSGLPGAASAVARALAVLGEGAELRNVARLAGLPMPAAVAGADALSAAGVLAPGPPLAFAHPLVSSAVYEDIPAWERAFAHRHAAELEMSSGAPARRVATHLLRAEPAGDDRSVDALLAAGAEARASGAQEAAVGFFERALVEPPPPELRARVLFELGAAERLARGTGAARLQAALGEITDPHWRVGVSRELANALVAGGRAVEAWRVLEDARAEAQGLGREATLSLDAELLGIGLLAIELAGRMPAVIRRLGPLRGETPAERAVLASLAYHEALVASGSGSQAAEWAELAWGDGRLLRDQTPDSPPFGWAASTFDVLEDHVRADALIEQGYADARARGSALGYAIVASVQCHPLLARGRVGEAEAVARSAIEVGTQASWKAGLPLAAATLVHALVEQGELAEADALLERLELAGPLPPLSLFQRLLHARGSLRLAQGRAEAGIGDLREMGDREARAGWSSRAIRWRSAAAPALAATGRSDEARELMLEEIGIVRRHGALRPQGMALRALALVSDEPQRTELLREACALLAPSAARLEHARALTDLGAALRRARHRADAREPLRQAIDLAHRCGAGALARRATEELEATGARARSPYLTGVDSLTPSERRVAEMAATGLPNPQIAQALFVTRKTVEKHLGSVYGKLGIRSRDELAAALAGDGG